MYIQMENMFILVNLILLGLINKAKAENKLLSDEIPNRNKPTSQVELKILRQIQNQGFHRLKLKI